MVELGYLIDVLHELTLVISEEHSLETSTLCLCRLDSK